jgi:CRISPR-associated endonuclease Csn1
MEKKLTPRGQLHNETVYGRIKKYNTWEEKISSKFTETLIQQVASDKYKKALLQRLHENNNDPKKAFTGKNSPDKNPIYIDEAKTQSVPLKVKLVELEDIYTCRKDITPDNFKDVKNIEKVMDVGVREILKQRLEAHLGNAKTAFSNLDKNPIWINKEQKIFIKRVTISGVKNAEALHYKKNHFGKLIIDSKQNKIPVDFVSTSNNHHVAIYRDEAGNLQDKIVSFFEAVERARQGLSVIDKTFNQHLGWKFIFTMKQNEYFIFPSEGFDPSEIDLLKPANNKLISSNLFRVQTISVVKYGNNTVRDFKFRHHLETSVADKHELKNITYKQIKSLPPLEAIVKVRINHIGQIVKVGEY